MFKKKCSKCKNKIEKTYDFCPFCGKNLKSKYDNEDFGFLGKNDFIEDEKIFGIGSGFMDKMINKAMKMIEKQMREMPNEFNQNPNQNQTNPRSNMHVQFFVNGKKVFPQKVQAQQNQNQGLQKKKSPMLSKQKAEKFAKLPRKEPKTTMKRLAGKLVYELAMPGVEDVEDVLINQLESSIEIKALSKNKVYSKTLNVNLPVIGYELDKGNLILELQAK